MLVIPWNEKWPELARGDVFPLPLAVETNWAADGWEVNVVLVSEASPDGYATRPVWSFSKPHETPGHAPTDEAARVTDEAMEAFADKLRRLLTDD